MIAVLLASASRAAWAAPPAATTEQQPLRVKIDVSALAKADAPHIERLTLERMEPLLRERSYTRADDAKDAIEIRFDYLDKKDFEYAIYVDIYDDGKLVKPGLDWFVCKFCPQTMLADTVAQNLPAAFDRLEQAEAEAASAEPAETNTHTEAEPEIPADESPKRVRPIGWLGITGAVVAGGGLATVIAGAVRLSQGRVVEPSASSLSSVTDYRPQGTALVGVGVAAVAVGAAALVADLVVRKKKRQALSFAPSFGPRSGAVTVSIRF